MSDTTTLTRPAEVTVLPDLDAGLGHQIGDEILLDTVLADAKAVGKVKASGRGRNQSHTARAWTSSGDVD